MAMAQVTKNSFFWILLLCLISKGETLINLSLVGLANLSSASGTAVLFGLDSQNAVWVKKQRSDGTFEDWTSLGGWIQKPVAGRLSNGKSLLLGLGSDNQVWMRKQRADSSFDGWTSLSGRVKRLAVGTQAGGSSILFAVSDLDNSLLVSMENANGTFNGWSSLEGWVSELATGNQRNGAAFVLGIGSDKAAWMRRQKTDGTFDYWVYLGGGDLQLKQLTLASRPNNDPIIFAVDKNNAVWMKKQTPDGNFEPWTSLGGWLNQLGIGRKTDGSLMLYGIGADNALWVRNLTAEGTWGNWISWGGWINQLTIFNQEGKNPIAIGIGSDNSAWMVSDGSWTRLENPKVPANNSPTQSPPPSLILAPPVIPPPAGNPTEQLVTTPCGSAHPGIPGPDETADCLGNVALPIGLINTDLVLVYNSIPSAVDKFYDNQGRLGPRIAKQVRFLNDATVFLANNAGLQLVLGDGSSIFYNLDSTTNRYLPNDTRVTNSIFEFSGSSLVQTLSSGEKLVFGRDPQDTSTYHLNVRKDISGRDTLTFNRNGFGQISSISGLFGFKGATLNFSSTQITISGNTLILDDKQRLTSISSVSPKTQSFQYRGASFLLSRFTDALGRTTNFLYDENGLLKKVTDPQNFPTDYSYRSGVTADSNICGSNGRPTGAVTVQTIDRRATQIFCDNKIAQVCRSDNTETCSRDTVNFSIVSRDSSGRVTSFNQMGLVTNYQYTLSGRFASLPTKIISPDGLTTDVLYDDRFWNMPVKKTVVSGSTGRLETSFEYSTPFQLTKRTVGQSVYTYQYNNLNQITSVILNNKPLMSASYDASGNLTSKTDLGNLTTLGNYTSAGLPGNLSRGSDTLSLGYDNLKRLNRISSETEGTRSFTYGSYGHVETDTLNWNSGGFRKRTRTISIE